MHENIYAEVSVVELKLYFFFFEIVPATTTATAVVVGSTRTRKSLDYSLDNHYY